MLSLYLDLANKVPVLVLLFLSAAAVISGDYFAKAWSVNHRTLFLVLSFTGYLFSAFLYTPTLLRKGLVYTALIWDLVGVIGFLFIGWVIFKEQISAGQLVGAILGAISLIILMATG